MWPPRHAAGMGWLEDEFNCAAEGLTAEVRAASDTAASDVAPSVDLGAFDLLMTGVAPLALPVRRRAMSPLPWTAR
jgi:hypothetical protein